MTIRETFISLAVLGLCPSSAAQEAGPAEAAAPAVTREALLAAPALQQAGRSYRVEEVLARLYPLDASLEPALRDNLEYLRLYLDSPRFYDQVRWFSNLLLLDAVEMPEVDRAALEAEAVAWAADRSIEADARTALALGGLEILARARLIGEQPDVLGSDEVRKHFNRSIPEFYGRVKLSWIRVPLFDGDTGRAFGEAERQARYGTLDEVAQRLQANELAWEKAVEEYSEDLISRRQGGRVGYVTRDDDRFDEEFLRQLFLDLGITAPQGAILRGPIMGSRWVYLARMEKIVSQGVVELNAVRPRVERSLRTYLIHQELGRLAAGVSRSVLLPVKTR
ncbi:MAG: peptidylprolyl isomerase [Planctomycetota bacterium]|jgi:hypothetical protein